MGLWFVWFLLIGALAGYITGRLTKGSGFGVVGDLVIGILGAFVGGFLFRLLGIEAYSLLGQLLMCGYRRHRSAETHQLYSKEPMNKKIWVVICLLLSTPGLRADSPPRPAKNKPLMGSTTSYAHVIKFKRADDKGQILKPGEKAPSTTLEESNKQLGTSSSTLKQP